MDFMAIITIREFWEGLVLAFLFMGFFFVIEEILSR